MIKDNLEQSVVRCTAPIVRSQAMKQSVQKELLETRVTKGKEATKQRPFQQC